MALTNSPNNLREPRQQGVVCSCPMLRRDWRVWHSFARMYVASKNLQCAVSLLKTKNKVKQVGVLPDRTIRKLSHSFERGLWRSVPSRDQLFSCLNEFLRYRKVGAFSSKASVFVAVQVRCGSSPSRPIVTLREHPRHVTRIACRTLGVPSFLRSWYIYTRTWFYSSAERCFTQRFVGLLCKHSIRLQFWHI